ncbi:hypothetical protein JMN32_06725 [Fulvivirga sp. 29W222]|uniref:Uncharacterized protein n=1 Tax=Fulvivirga marina TaxID=2494733 RepID=A0A937FX44_9BACT|nr:hypothetical protein [Fulvivirga marina]MBL6445995.1 hypothetical protein [Fulvivirga marina]
MQLEVSHTQNEMMKGTFEPWHSLLIFDVIYTHKLLGEAMCPWDTVGEMPDTFNEI